MNNKFSYQDLHYGRQRIILDFDEVTPENIFQVMQKALGIHRSNARDCDYLIKYLLGKQDILERPGNYTNQINNKTVINNAMPITREIVGYTYGNPVELIQKNMKYQQDVSMLSDYYDYETSYYVDICTAIYCSVCGVGYQITLPSKDISKDNTPELPIVYTYLDPRNTFVVQSSEVGNPTIMSCHYTINSQTHKTEYTCYTNKYKMTFSDMNPDTLLWSNNPIGLNPITLVENSLFLTGDWEQAISVFNAINQVASDSLNDIEGTIKSLLVVLGAEFDEDDDGASLEKVKNNRILTLTRASGDSSNLDAKFIAPQLDSTSTQNIREYLDEVKNIITGIPDRSSNSSGGDTGLAVLNRDGWTDIEIVARLKELFFKKAKKQQLAVGIKILQMLDKLSSDLTVMDIDLIIGRHSQDNLQTKTQAFASLVATGELATIDCLELSNLTNKTREMVERGKQAKLERQEEAIEMAKRAAEASGEGDSSNSTSSSKNGANKTAELEKAMAGNNSKSSSSNDK